MKRIFAALIFSVLSISTAWADTDIRPVNYFTGAAGTIPASSMNGGLARYSSGCTSGTLIDTTQNGPTMLSAFGITSAQQGALVDLYNSTPCTWQINAAGGVCWVKTASLTCDTSISLPPGAHRQVLATYGSSSQINIWTDAAQPTGVPGLLGPTGGPYSFNIPTSGQVQLLPGMLVSGTLTFTQQLQQSGSFGWFTSSLAGQPCGGENVFQPCIVPPVASLIIDSMHATQIGQYMYTSVSMQYNVCNNVLVALCNANTIYPANTQYWLPNVGVTYNQVDAGGNFVVPNGGRISVTVTGLSPPSVLITHVQ